MKAKSKAWVSATKTHSHLLGDNLVDYLSLRNGRPIARDNLPDGGNVPRGPKETFINALERKNLSVKILMRMGDRFEENIIQRLAIRHNLVSLPGTFSDKAVDRTIELMKEGVEIIHSGSVKHPREKIYGMPDLLVRNDIISSIVSFFPDILEPKQSSNKARKIGSKWFYYAVDIKWSTLPLRSNGIGLLNTGRYKAYKGQLTVYRNALGWMQGYRPKYSFILGNGFSYTCKDTTYTGQSPLSRLGMIEHLDFDKVYVEKTSEALGWCRNVSSNYRDWTLDPPSVPELYPNMSVDSGEYNLAKEEIAIDLGEITMLWYCGVKNRQAAFDKGIRSFRDPGCSAEALGLKGTRGKIVDMIIDINCAPYTSGELITPINEETHGEVVIDGVVLDDIMSGERYELYVDFETISSAFGSEEGDTIFAIGAYILNNDTGTFGYRNYISNRNSKQEEYRIMNEFVSMVKSYGKPPIYVWSGFEERVFGRNCVYHNKAAWIYTCDFRDLCKVFTTTPIVVKGAFNFKLKCVGKALKTSGLISTDIPNNGCSNGMDAMVMASQIYREVAITGEDPFSVPEFESIIDYHQTDCKLLLDIVQLLRKNYYSGESER
jgi:hypothetical protein